MFGFTLVELVVCLSILTLLLALILPAVQSARESSRRVQCTSRIKQVSLGLLNWTESHGRFPASGYWGGDVVLDKRRPSPHHNWVVEILPWIDQASISETWNHDQLMNDPVNRRLTETHLSVLTCPSDDSLSGRGDLSFALNGGIGESIFREVHDCITDPFYRTIDLNGNGVTCRDLHNDESAPSDRSIYLKMGLFFNSNYQYDKSPGYPGTTRHHRPATVRDGLSNTLMVAENVKTGFDSRTQDANHTTWATADARRNRVYFSAAICPRNRCNDGVNLTLANAGKAQINGGLKQPEGEAPYPNSRHTGGVNVSMADGSCRFLSDSIDGQTYFQLFTPQGNGLPRQFQ